MIHDTLGQIDHLSFQIDGNNESNRARKTDMAIDYLEIQ